MILRPRQKTFVKLSRQALSKHKNTLSVAATGFGKTVALSAVISETMNGGRALVLAHRDELTRQNLGTFSQYDPNISTSIFDANTKSWRGLVTFGMVQTVTRHVENMPAFDLLVVDEAHHIAAPTYQRVIDQARKRNPRVKILGVTATPERSDKKGLASVFNNVADVVTIGELVRSGHLVPPVGRVIDIGTQDELRKVKRTVADYDMAEVEAIQNTTINNNQIVEYWMENSADRPSVAFTSTVQHAQDVRDSFRDAGIVSEAIHGELSKTERRGILAAFDRGEIQMLTNPFILTEGWDSQICSAVLLLRTSSHKSTVIQMAGRGLRKLDPRRYRGRTKPDCLILDFGISLLTHGNLDAEVKLGNVKQAEGIEAKKKDCPDCGAELPVRIQICPLCGYEFKVEITEDGYYNELEELRLIEIDLINASPFRWISLFPSDKVLIATGFESWAAVTSADGENWYSIGGKGRQAQLLTIANRVGAVASADDFMRQNETGGSAKKMSLWMNQPASQKQIQTLNRRGVRAGRITKIEAAAHLTFKFNQSSIEREMRI